MKKIVSIFLTATTLLVSCNFSIIANAETGVAVTIATTDNKAAMVGNTLKATVSGAGDNAIYQWYADDVAIIGATEETFVPTYDQHKKAVKCVVTVDGEEVSSGAVTVTSLFNETLKYNNMVWREVGANGTADLTGDNSWEFSMTNEYGANLSFSLLDTFNNSDAKYYIMANNLYGSYKTPGTIAKYDPTENGSMAHYVNTEFIQDAPWEWNLPKAVIDTLDYDHVWVTEKEYTGSKITSHYTYTAAVTVPAIWEMEKYKSRIRFKVGGGNYAYLFRTPYNDTNYHVYAAGTTVTRTEDGETTVGIVHGNDGKWWYKLAPQGVGEKTIAIRPEFFVNEDFFETAKIDLATAGEEIINEIAKVEADILKELYTKEDLIEYLGFNESDFEGDSGNDDSGDDSGDGSGDDDSGNDDPGNDDSGNDDTEFDGVYFAEERTVNYDMPWAPNSNKPIARQTADPDYVFTVKNGENNESFTLLDVDADGTASKYFVIANQAYGKAMIFDSNSDVANYWKNPTSEEKADLGNNTDTIAKKYPTYWLDGDHFEKGWLLNGAAYKFGTSPLIPYIDNKHIWTCEPAPDAAVPNEKYTFTAGIALPSASELDTYIDRLGIGDVDSFGTRTMINYKNGDTTYRYMGVASSSETKWYPGHWSLPQTGSVKIRPVCWLNDEFFANVEVDLSTAGAAVKQEIAKVEYNALKALYTEEDLLTYLDITEADYNDYVIKNVTVEKSGEGVATVSGNVKTNVQGVTDAVIIVGIYDDENIMVGSAATGIMLKDKGDRKKFDLTVGALPDDEYTVKIMLWDNLFDAGALTNQYEEKHSIQ